MGNIWLIVGIALIAASNVVIINVLGSVTRESVAFLGFAATVVSMVGLFLIAITEISRAFK